MLAAILVIVGGGWLVAITELAAQIGEGSAKCKTNCSANNYAVPEYRVGAKRGL